MAQHDLSRLVLAASAQDPSSLCSLEWTKVLRNFGRESGWSPAPPPLPLSGTEDGTPEYQAEVFESRGADWMALIVAEWGDPDSPELGPVVYCTIRDARGQVLEEIGTNPLRARVDAPPCARCT